jgi:hypothetical protein
MTDITPKERIEMAKNGLIEIIDETHEELCRKYGPNFPKTDADKEIITATVFKKIWERQKEEEEEESKEK